MLGLLECESEEQEEEDSTLILNFPAGVPVLFPHRILVCPAMKKG